MVPSSAPCSELYTTLASQARTSVHRLRITKGSDGSSIPNTSSIILQTTGLRHQSTIYVKDLGPQIPWRTVFVIEYLGPLLIHPILYFTLPHTSIPYLQHPTAYPPFSFLPSLLNNPSSQIIVPSDDLPSLAQTLTLIMTLLHFTKREVETLYIHRFSASTMPAFNIFKNSGHYWGLSGLVMAFFVYVPSSSTAAVSAYSPLIYLGLALFAVGEILNFNTHLSLRDLRKEGSTERGIPKGLGFDWVTCPNYLFELMAWLGILLVSWNWTVILFAAVAIIQMYLWSWKKERRYRKEFGAAYKKKRYAMLPGLI